jgi:hypothetical protein
MVIDLIAWLGGCRHSRYSWPFGRPPEEYVVCLDCGRRLPYSWAEMTFRAEEKKKHELARA